MGYGQKIGSKKSLFVKKMQGCRLSTNWKFQYLSSWYKGRTLFTR